jgi:hypothetical protein
MNSLSPQSTHVYFLDAWRMLEGNENASYADINFHHLLVFVGYPANFHRDGFNRSVQHHVDHFRLPCSPPEQASVVTWIRFRRSQPPQVGQFLMIVNSVCHPQPGLDLRGRQVMCPARLSHRRLALADLQHPLALTLGRSALDLLVHQFTQIHWNYEDRTLAGLYWVITRVRWLRESS